MQKRQTNGEEKRVQIHMYYKVGEYINISVVLVPMSKVILNLCQMPFLMDVNVMLQLIHEIECSLMCKI